MPTSFASNATAPRIFSASRSRTSSASGSMVLVKISLQQNLRRERIAHGLARFRRCAASARRSFLRRETFVSERNGKRESPAQLAAEAPRARRHHVRGAVGVRRQTDEKKGRTRFGDERRDRGEMPLAAVGERGERMRDTEACFADRYADALGAEIEGENSPRWGRGSQSRHRHVYACPTASERREKSMPRSFMAAGKRISGGSPKSTCASAATVSQAFCAISCSSWLAAQPAYPSVTSTSCG